jgi:tRNA isopentenyl-2-thiomethyl-A-37 hydroxylase MiaE
MTPYLKDELHHLMPVADLIHARQVEIVQAVALVGLRCGALRGHPVRGLQGLARSVRGDEPGVLRHN